MKNLFTTRLFWGWLFTLFLSISPKLQELEKKQFTIADWIQVFSALASASLVLMDFHEEDKKIYTPRFLPGRDKQKSPIDEDRGQD